MDGGRDKAILLLKTARGQVEGTLRMIEEDKYCIDISNQILAAGAVLAKANREILRGHINGCMRAAFKSEDEGYQQEILAELMSVMEKM